MEKKKKKLIIGSAIVIGITSITGVILYKYLRYEINREGSDLWFKHASLKDLEKYREKIGEQYRDAGLNNLNDDEFYFLERMKFKLDHYIDTIKGAIFYIEHPDQKVVHHEHGWYLQSDD